MTSALTLATGWLLFSGLVLSIGAVAGRSVIAPLSRDGGELVGPWVTGQAARLGLLGVTVLLLGLGLVFWRQLVEFRDPFVPWTEDAGLLLSGTPWGGAWKAALAAAVVAAVAFLRLFWKGGEVGWWLAAPAVLALGAFPAFTGHAAATGGLRPLTLAADTVHVWSAGGWLGGLTLVLAAAWRWRSSRPGAHASILPVLVTAFSPLAVACVGLLILTGVLAAWVQVPNLESLATTAYGRLLLLKVALAFVAFSLGAVNWRRLTPRLREAGGAQAMRNSAAVEILVAHAVLLVTAVLVRASPSGQ